MKSPMLLLHVLSSLCFGMTATLAISLSLPGCPEKCGNITIPYPFGIGSDCSGNSSFDVTCNSNISFLSSINMEILNISLFGALVVKQPLSPVNCSKEMKTGSLPLSFKGRPFTISADYNTLAVLGCNNSVWLRVNKTDTSGGCTPMCNANSSEISCNGVNCCQTTIPERLKEIEYTYKSTQDISSNGLCGYVFPVEKKGFVEDYIRYKGLLRFDGESGFAPLVLEWEFGELKGTYDGVCSYSDDACSYTDDSGSIFIRSNNTCLTQYRNNNCKLYPSIYSCNDMSSAGLVSFYPPNVYVSFTKSCSCPRGYEGNPYLPNRCSDIDECTDAHNVCPSLPCINMKGGYECQYPDKTRIRIAFISIGSVIGALALLLVTWKSSKAIRKRIQANKRRRFFKRNGGLLLEQQLSATDNGVEKTKLYSSKELAQATDHYNENRILGHGGQGTLYKGMLKDGMIIAVKKSKKVEEGDLQVFINEVVILSQVNHRNVVKLLGCCLETDVPLLVYEFVPNGTLLHHIHEPNEEFPLTWEMRDRIAKEVAGALAYLHSAASVPIYHRDIKSTNILLDEKYRAKISDFGTSRSINIDQSHLTTRVLGTFGYFDPEYFQSSQFTDKSDVYSFGVVLVELLTGERAISSTRVELGRNLATHFLHSMEENQLFDILDARVLEEGKREEIVAVAHLARRCLHLNGKRRPTMKAVAAQLEAVQEREECSDVVQNLDGTSYASHSLEGDEYDNFSSISDSTFFVSVDPFLQEPDHPLLDEP